jgi:predicted dehydrogenase
MNDRIRCGILGTGHAHALGKLRVLRDSPDFELVGVCEPDPYWRERSMRTEEFASARWVEEDKLLGDPTIRMIAVESDVKANLPLARKAIEADKHIHLDKPPGTSLEEFRELLELAENKGLIVQMGYMFRYNPGFEFILNAVRQGWLGDIFYAHGSICTDIDPEARRRLAFHPGGMMFELGCHLLDMMVLLFGRPRRVTPILRHDGPYEDDLADNTLAVLEFDDLVATLESSAMEPNAFGRRTFEVCGTMGSIVLRPIEPPAIKVSLREPRGEFKPGWSEVPVENVPRYVRDFEELARCIRGEQVFPYSKVHDFIVQETLLRACGII